jgi:hypothetical protein
VTRTTQHSAHPNSRRRHHHGPALALPAQGHPGKQGRTLALSLLLAGLLPGLLTACAEEPLPQRQISPADCLSDVRMDRLKESLERCDKVVATYPMDPLPLNERYLLHTLADDEKAACRDMARAVELARRIPPQRLDPLLRQDLQLRQADCRSVHPEAAKATASPAASPAVQQLPNQNR